MKISRSVLATAIVGLLSIFSGLLVWIVTADRVGASPDSAHYISAARSLIDGRGLYTFLDDGSIPLTHFPPLFPVVLGGLGAVGLDLWQGLRAFHSLLAGANTLLVGLWVYRATAGRVWAGGLAALFMVLSRAMMSLYVMAWSEPIFIFLMLCGLWMLLAYLARMQRRFLLGSAALFGLALLARYVGASFIAAGLLGLLALRYASPVSLRRRLVDAVLFGGISILPLGLWLLHNAAATATTSATGRAIAVHLVTLDYILDGFAAVVNWVLPGFQAALAGLLAVYLFALVPVVVVIWVVRRLRGKSAAPMLARTDTTLLAISIGAYIGFLAVSISFVDANIPVDDRILSPLFPLTLILCAVLISERLHGHRVGSRAGLALALIGVFLVGYQVKAMFEWGSTPIESYTSLDWEQSETIAWIAALPDGVKIYSDAPGAIYLWTGRFSSRIPFSKDPTTGMVNPDYARQLLLMGCELERGGFLILFDKRTSIPYFPTEDDLLARLPLELEKDTEDGVIYTMSASQPCPNP